jgi:RES domain-containing protein
MRAFRLTRAKYPPFSGRGSLLVSGRWHWAGVPVEYCAEGLALAVLETLRHTRKDQIPSDYVFYEVEISDTQIELVSPHMTPPDWTAAEPVLARDFGTEWVKERRSLGLLIPSVVMEGQRILLLNPEHPGFSELRITGPHQFQYDDRLFG